MSFYNLAYGHDYLNFNIPDNLEIQTIEAVSTHPIQNFQEEVLRVLNNPIDSPPLREVVKRGEKVAILVSDITRLAYRSDGYLPILLNELNQSGVKDQDITIVITTGTHKIQTEKEDRLVVGEEVYNRVNVVNHDCMAPDLVDLGISSRGTSICINRKVYEADRIILTGGISYHPLAGFGGGRKSIMPGVCSYKGIQQNHRLGLMDTDTGSNPNVGPGILCGNPVAEDMDEIAEIVKPDFLVNVVVNEKKEYIAITAGQWREAFLAGCKVVERDFGVPIHSKSDLVIASCGGYPKDIQLYQSMKGLENAIHAVRPGGVIVLCSESSQGTGSDDFMKWFKYSQYVEMKDALQKEFTMPGYVALNEAHITSSANVILISSLPDETVRKINMIPVHSPQEAWETARGILGEVNSVSMMPFASLTVPITKG